jgi:glycosyltransferase involved in cell wall biosynthesis
MSGPEVSVVIPVYNKEPHIERCLSSVLGQTYRNFEVLMIDDASTDGSLQQLQRANDSRVRILRRQTPGPGGYAARNLGIREARSPWVAFLDADDEWSTEHLARTRELMAEFPRAEVLSCGWIVHRSAVERSVDGYYRSRSARGNHGFGLPEFIRGPRPIWTSVVTVRRDRLLDAGGFDERWKHGGDTALWLKLLLAGCEGAWYAGLGATYFMDSVNMVTSNLTQTESPASRVVQEHLRRNPSDPRAAELRRYADRAMTKPTLRMVAEKGLSPADLRGRYFFARRRSRAMVMLAHLPRFAQMRIARTLLNRYR